MNENDKAAIAARLWKHHSECPRGEGRQARFHPAAPDMHDPANLWRALENRHLDIIWDGHSWEFWNAEDYLSCGFPLNEAMFAALIALYDAEHGE